MRSAFYEKTGPARDVLRVDEVPTPEPGPGEVRVRVHAAGVNPVDGYARAGYFGPLPFSRVIPGFDGAGIVDRVGEGTSVRVGDRVWLFNGQWQRASGTTAQYIVLPEAQVVPLPSSMSFEAGATLGVASCTAHVVLTADGPVKGQTVLVAGGAGGTSLFLIQLAKWYGARVITTVSSEEKAEVARGAGADHVVNYKASDDVAAEILRLTAGRGVDRVAEVALGANFELDAAVLAAGGVITAYGSPGNFSPTFPFIPLMFKGGRVRSIGGFGVGPENLLEIRRALEQGVLVPRIWKRYPLADIALAHEDQDANRPIGKIVIQVDET